ncbi:MAG TPA: DUF4382 domain-containing protein [Steroidobacteraceae bacterium]|nr:DUF4382 domain-containing protein [Steroidobacteraceae bacterium]
MLPSNIRFHSRYYAALLALLVLGACSGGGGGMDGTTNPTPTPQGQATVGVLLTDAPGTPFSEINATITGITLMGRGAPQTVFSGSNTIDLLKLDSSSDLFALSTTVAPGSFQKIRLTLSDLELVRRDAAGNVVERIHPHLPGNGKLDLNLQQSMAAAPGDTLLLELDFDMQKSIQIVGTGSGRVNFRPVIFVRLLQKSLNGRLARVAGVIGAIDATAQTFDLCDLVRNVPEMTTRSSSDDHMGDHCVEVALDAKTTVFGANGDALTFADLKQGDPATAIGRISKQDDAGDNDSDDQDENDGGMGGSDSNGDHDGGDLRLDAVVLEVGPPGSFARLKGTIKTAPDATTKRFDLGVDAGQGFAPDTLISTLVQDGTRIFGKDGTELAIDAIQVDRAARVDGVLQLSSTDPDTLKSSLIVVDTQAPNEETVVRGDVLTLDAATQSFTMTTATGDRCVHVADTTAIFLITISDSEFSSDRGTFADLVAGNHVDVFGSNNADGCVDAAVVIAEKTAT